MSRPVPALRAVRFANALPNSGRDVSLPPARDPTYSTARSAWSGSESHLYLFQIRVVPSGFVIQLSCLSPLATEVFTRPGRAQFLSADLIRQSRVADPVSNLA